MTPVVSSPSTRKACASMAVAWPRPGWRESWERSPRHGPRHRPRHPHAGARPSSPARLPAIEAGIWTATSRSRAVVSRSRRTVCRIPAMVAAMPATMVRQPSCARRSGSGMRMARRWRRAVRGDRSHDSRQPGSRPGPLPMLAQAFLVDGDDDHRGHAAGTRVEALVGGRTRSRAATGAPAAGAAEARAGARPTGAPPAGRPAPAQERAGPLPAPPTA